MKNLMGGFSAGFGFAWGAMVAVGAALIAIKGVGAIGTVLP